MGDAADPVAFVGHDCGIELVAADASSGLRVRYVRARDHAGALRKSNENTGGRKIEMSVRRG